MAGLLHLRPLRSPLVRRRAALNAVVVPAAPSPQAPCRRHTCRIPPPRAPFTTTTTTTHTTPPPQFEEDPDAEFTSTSAAPPPLDGPRIIDVGITGPGFYPLKWRRAWRDKVRRGAGPRGGEPSRRGARLPGRGATSAAGRPWAAAPACCVPDPCSLSPADPAGPGEVCAGHHIRVGGV